MQEDLATRRTAHTTRRTGHNARRMAAVRRIRAGMRSSGPGRGNAPAARRHRAASTRGVMSCTRTHGAGAWLERMDATTGRTGMDMAGRNMKTEAGTQDTEQTRTEAILRAARGASRR